MARAEVTGRKPGTTGTEVALPPPTGPPALAVTINEAARLTSLSVATIWNLAGAGRLTLIRPAGLRRTLVSMASIKQFLGLEG